MASLSFFLCGLVATGAERRVRRRPPARSVAVKRTAEMENCDETIFYTSVVLGGQTLQLIVDSGSADSWVVGKDCPGGCNATTVFDRDASPTFAASGGRAEIDYEDGDGVAGARARDTLEWAGVQVDAMDFLEVDRSGFWICGAEDGVLGLGPSAESRLGAPSFLERVASRLEDPLVGVAIRDDGSVEVTLGGLDGGRFVAPLAWLDAVDGVPWTASLAGVSDGTTGAAIAGPRRASFDTGTTYLLLPADDALAAMAAIDALCYAWSDARNGYDVRKCADQPATAEVHLALADCDVDARLRFDFGQGRVFDLEASTYLTPQRCDGDDEFLDCRGLCWPAATADYAADDSCDDGRLGPDFNCPAFDCDAGACADVAGVAPCAADPYGVRKEQCYVDVDQSERAGEWILGDVFLRVFYVALNLTDARVGVAASSHGSPQPTSAPTATEAPPRDDDDDDDAAARASSGPNSDHLPPLAVFLLCLLLAAVVGSVCLVFCLAKRLTGGSFRRARPHYYEDPNDDPHDIHDPEWCKTPEARTTAASMWPSIELPSRSPRVDIDDVPPLDFRAGHHAPITQQDEVTSALHAHLDHDNFDEQGGFDEVAL